MKETEGQKGFMLFACCIPVKGAARSIVCDLQRSEYVFITNELSGLLANGRFLSSQEIQEMAEWPNGLNLLEQLKSLENREFGFWCSEAESRMFPLMKLQWETPKLITHAIIDSDRNSEHPFPEIFKQLLTVGCQAVQLRFFDLFEIQKVESILESAQKHGFTDAELIIVDAGDSNSRTGLSLSIKFPVLTKIIFHSASSNRLLSNEGTTSPIYQITNRITSADHCGFIHPDGFVVGKELFSEAQAQNSCLNGKISIDSKGNIKNCPAMGLSLGNINKVRLDTIIPMEKFRLLGNTNKNQISVCQDCEFRYICTDCRAHVVDKNDLYSKPAKCFYDPYTATWAGYR